MPLAGAVYFLLTSLFKNRIESTSHFYFLINSLIFPANQIHISIFLLFLVHLIVAQKMHKKNEIKIKNSQKIGICHRLYSFILKTFFSPTPKAVTMGHTLNSDTEHQMLLKDQSTLQDSNLVTSSEILVEFRHNIGSSNRKENDENSRVDIIKPQETRFGGDLQAISFIKVKGKEPKKMVTIEEFTGKYQKDSNEEQQQRNINISRDEPHSVKKHTVPRLLTVDTNISDQPHSIKKHRVPRLLTVDENINEKSDAFIRKKKAAMERELQH